VKDELWKPFKDSEKNEMQRIAEERKEYDAGRIASDAERREKRKKTRDEAELEQDQQDHATKRRQTGGSSDSSSRSASAPGQTLLG
jgi:hypothetical protein